MDQTGQQESTSSTDVKVVLIWIGIGVLGLLIVLVVIALILLFIKARKRFRELDEDMHMKAFRRSLVHYEEEGAITRTSEHKGSPCRTVSSTATDEPQNAFPTKTDEPQNADEPRNADEVRCTANGGHIENSLNTDVTSVSHGDAHNHSSFTNGVSVLPNNSNSGLADYGGAFMDELKSSSGYRQSQTKNAKRKQAAEMRLKTLTSSDTDSETKIAAVSTKVAKRKRGRNHTTKDNV